jgi:hypothetical protein
MNKQAQEMKAFEDARLKATKAVDTLLQKLFGSVPEKPSDFVASRADYKKSMEEVEQEFGYTDGNPDVILFILEQLSRSPRLTDTETTEGGI